MTFNLLIIYKNKEKKVIPGVTRYGLNEYGCFSFEKNGFRSFVPRDNVLFFGREFDYKN